MPAHSIHHPKNPTMRPMNKKPLPKENTNRYWYSCVGYGICSKAGRDYASGRIEVRDEKSKSGYAVDEYYYWVPLEIEDKWRTFWDGLETKLPMYVAGGDAIREITHKQLNSYERKAKKRKRLHRHNGVAKGRAKKTP